MKHGGSFRDPAGFVFSRNGEIFRQINEVGRADFELLESSGLYAELTGRGLLIPHEQVDVPGQTDAGQLVIRPETVDFISYPYEWCFTQLQDAALATLAIQKIALGRGMVLKDASAYNIQFHQGKPTFIDTLSFTAYHEGEAWAAYRQFCQHFVAPLALMAKVDPALIKLTATNIDGIPLALAVKLLPRRSLLSPGLLMHLGLHSSMQSRNASEGAAAKATLSRTRHLALIESLQRTVTSLKWRPAGTEWGEYYTFTNYTEAAFKQKKSLVAQLIRQVSPATTWDLGGNTGEFSRLASEAGSSTVCFDIDPVAVEKNYRHMKRLGEPRHLPLLMDLTAPSAATGWANQERYSLTERGPAGLVMALALIHHLAISNNLPFAHIASYFAALGEYLIIEFVPKDDSKVKLLLSSRPDIFPLYTPEGFEAEFKKFFTIEEKLPIISTKRTLYLMKRREYGKAERESKAK